MTLRRESAGSVKSGRKVGGQFAAGHVADSVYDDDALTLESDTPDWDKVSTSLHGKRITWENTPDGVVSNQAINETWWRLRVDSDYWTNRRAQASPGTLSWRDDIDGILVWGGNIVAGMLEEGYIAPCHDAASERQTGMRFAPKLPRSSLKRVARSDYSCAKTALTATHEAKRYLSEQYQATVLLAQMRSANFLAREIAGESVMIEVGGMFIRGDLGQKTIHPLNECSARATEVYVRYYGRRLFGDTQEATLSPSQWKNGGYLGERGDLLWQILKEECTYAELRGEEVGDLIEYHIVTARPEYGDWSSMKTDATLSDVDVLVAADSPAMDDRRRAAKLLSVAAKEMYLAAAISDETIVDRFVSALSGSPRRPHNVRDFSAHMYQVTSAAMIADLRASSYDASRPRYTAEQRDRLIALHTASSTSRAVLNDYMQHFTR